MKRQPALAESFRELHHADTPLVLPNAWDAGTARLMEHVGCKAVATTSGGVAWSHGYQDVDQLPTALLTTTVASISRVVSVPVSVDIGSGYSGDLDEVTAMVTKVVEAGAVAVNIENGDDSLDTLCNKVVCIREVGEQLGVSLFVNVRTDVYLRGLVGDEERVAEVIRRAQRYQSAGADGLFVPLLSEPSEIQEVSAAVALPLNVMACPGLPNLAELGRLGVQRLSSGTGITRAVYAHACELAASFLRDGELESVFTNGMCYTDINVLFP